MVRQISGKFIHNFCVNLLTERQTDNQTDKHYPRQPVLQVTSTEKAAEHATRINQTRSNLARRRENDEKMARN